MGDFGEASFSSSFTSSPSFFTVVFPAVAAGMSVAVVSFDPTPPPRPQLAKRLEGEGIDGNWTNTEEEEEVD